MLKVVYAPEAVADLDRFLDHMARFGVADAEDRISDILQAVQTLARSPFIGRPVKGCLRELVIGRGARGYVALYRIIPGTSSVLVLAIRNQREGGYRR